jgi:hypothetical protein
MNFCTKCGSPLKPDVRFCSKCGEPLTHVNKQEQAVEMPVCRSCGAGIKPGVKFCINCGIPVSPPSPPDKKPPPVTQPAMPQSIGKQRPVVQKPQKSNGRKLLTIAFSITVILSAVMAGLYFFGTYDAGTDSSNSGLAEEEKYDPVKIDSAATAVETVFAASDTAGLANILSPTTLEYRRQYFGELLPYMPAFANDFKTRKLLYATSRYAVYEFSSADGKFTAGFCLGDKGQWLLMNF